MQGKLTSFTPKMNGQQQETYMGERGLLYKFNVTFDNGNNGTANSTKQQPSWKIGEEYIYELNEYAKGNIIKGMKKVEGPNIGGYATKHNEDEAKSIAYQVATDCVISYIKTSILSITETQLWNAVNQIYEMMIPYSGERRTSILSCSAMKKAIEIATSEISLDGYPNGKIPHLIGIKDLYLRIYNRLLTCGKV